jgi:hypothetical protein
VQVQNHYHRPGSRETCSARLTALARALPLRRAAGGPVGVGWAPARTTPTDVSREPAGRGRASRARRKEAFSYDPAPCFFAVNAGADPVGTGSARACRPAVRFFFIRGAPASLRRENRGSNPARYGRGARAHAGRPCGCGSIYSGGTVPARARADPACTTCAQTSFSVERARINAPFPGGRMQLIPTSSLRGIPAGNNYTQHRPAGGSTAAQRYVFRSGRTYGRSDPG